MNKHIIANCMEVFESIEKVQMIRRTFGGKIVSRFDECVFIVEAGRLYAIAEQSLRRSKFAPSSIKIGILQKIEYRLIVIAAQINNIPARPIQVREAIDDILGLRPAIDVIA